MTQPLQHLLHINFSTVAIVTTSSPSSPKLHGLTWPQHNVSRTDHSVAINQLFLL
ncbi:hypothetical protein ACQKE0_16265 [Shewanella colwelliana]|uniref:hypothetical protein n=1 Tax=Shewanella colwelliana TaxID=23 RepID=UPI000A701BCB|nr:hypothetical protein [Shewanella colwelliana]